MKAINGHHIKCASCDGHGMVATWSFGVKEPDECPWCGGSGKNWRYQNGAIAKYYAGPLIGFDRQAAKPAKAARLTP